MMNAISLLASATASNRDTYSNLLGTVTSLMSQLVTADKNLFKLLKDNVCLEHVLGQF